MNWYLIPIGLVLTAISIIGYFLNLRSNIKTQKKNLWEVIDLVCKVVFVIGSMILGFVLFQFLQTANDKLTFGACVVGGVSLIIGIVGLPEKKQNQKNTETKVNIRDIISKIMIWFGALIATGAIVVMIDNKMF